MNSAGGAKLHSTCTVRYRRNTTEHFFFGRGTDGRSTTVNYSEYKLVAQQFNKHYVSGTKREDFEGIMNDRERATASLDCAPGDETRSRK
jgi:hypothetical protein